MAILHGSWLLQSQQPISAQAATAKIGDGRESQTGCFFLWGEIWRRINPDSLRAEPTESQDSLGTLLPHPYALSQTELLDLLRGLQEAGKLKLPELSSEQWQSQTIALPSYMTEDSGKGAIVLPHHSATAPEHPPMLYPWQVEGVCLAPAQAMQFLNSLPLGVSTSTASFLSGDLRFWSHIARWSLDLLARCKFLPGLEFHKAEEKAEGRRQKAEGEEDGERGRGGEGERGGWGYGERRTGSDISLSQSPIPNPQSPIPNPQSPTPNPQPPTALAHWQPLLDSGVDQVRLIQFVEQMPVACRMYQKAEEKAKGKAKGKRQKVEGEDNGQKAEGENVSFYPLPAGLVIDLPAEPQELLVSFLAAVVDAQVRSLAQTQPFPGMAPEKGAKGNPTGTGGAIAAPVRDWLEALAQPSAVVVGNGLESLQTALTNWMTPLQYRRTESLFRTCLYLYTPQPGQRTWQLDYCLQAVDDPEFLVDATTIWNNPVEQLTYRGRTILQPQETFLMGLGLASRLYPLIEPSLQEARPQTSILQPLQAYDLIKTTAWRLQDSGIGVVLPPSLAGQGNWANRLGLKIQAQTAKLGKGQRLGLQNLLNFRWELSIGGQTLSKAEFDRLVALNTPLVEINSEWVELRPQDIRAAQTFFTSRKDQTTLSLEDALRISTGDTQMIEKLPVVSFEASGALQELINTITGNRTIDPIAEPAGFRGELRPYQARGVGWLAFLEQWGLGACLADDMGLGKTIQFIAFLLHLKQQNALEKPTLLICPTSVLGNWEREVKKFGPELKVILHHGDGRPKGKAFARAVQGKDLVITSYALVHRDAKDLQSLSWRGVVLDEAQNVKNPEAKQSQAVRQFEAEFRIGLTGTPVENRLSELWSIMDFLNPGYLGPKNFFQRRFATPIERYGDTDSLKTLRSLVQPFILRRLKSDRDIIQDLPDKQEMTVFCGLTSEQAALYQQIVDKSLAEIEAAEGIQRRGVILALLVKLKQICNHPALFLKDEGGGMKDGKASPSFQTRSGKLQRLEEMLEEVVAEGDRALIFTQFAEWGKLLKSHLEKSQMEEVLFLYGSTPKKQREEMVDRFQHDPQAPRIFILSLKAGGVGLNLTRANHVFHFDRWWNPAVENQATDRVFRIGQTRNVQVHKFVCNGTLEEKIHDLIESKKALAEQVVGAGENWLTELDTNQLRDLLLLDRSAIIGEE
jgi:SNF2 family DNA or RNA helicase